MCLLDIPSSSISVDSEEAKEVEKRNEAYAEICRTRQGNDKYVDRAMQTLNAALKCKEVQSYDVNMDEKASIYSSQNEMEDSTAQTVSKAEQEQILHSEKFKQSLQAMEKMVLLNINQCKLAACTGLPILPDPDSVSNLDMENGTEEDNKEDKKVSLSPALELLWAYSHELTKDQNVISMAWNKQNPDVLAVGYGETDIRNEKAGVVCIWSLKNPTRPEIFFTCKTSVTSLDFSASQPSHLAVGLYDGTIAIYNLHSSQASLVCDSRNCPQKHMFPVWQVKWVLCKQVASKDKKEKLFSVSADGRISEWFLQVRFQCTDLMKLKRIRNEKTEKEWKDEPLISCWAVGLCFDFHHNDSQIYLVGTEEGHIQECSSRNEQLLETYTNHLGPVYKVTWSPFCRDVFLSCSADCSIQLWIRGYTTPMLNFPSSKKAVYDIMWSPRWATVFGAVNEARLEIWDLGASILSPTLVSEIIPDVKPTCLLFSISTDCVLVGDSEGHVRVYKLQNFTAGEETQEDTLNDILSSKHTNHH